MLQNSKLNSNNTHNNNKSNNNKNYKIFSNPNKNKKTKIMLY